MHYQKGSFLTLFFMIIVSVSLFAAKYAAATEYTETKEYTEYTEPAERTEAGAQAKETDKVRVRVGFPIQPGFTDKDADGEYCGYTVDYLNQLVRYTNWEIEYVEVSGDQNTQMAALMEMLEAGEIDMLGAMSGSEGLEERFYYPGYYYGVAYTTLAVRAGADRYMDEDYQNWDGIRIAVSPSMAGSLELFRKFAELGGFTYEIMEYDSYLEMVNAVLKGDADAVIQTDLSMIEGMRTIARFNPTPYYFAVSRNRADLLGDLNRGMNSLLKSYPNLQPELYRRYFTSEGKFYISEENRKWIQSLPVMKVLFYKGNAPIQYEDDGMSGGVAEQFLNAFSRETGFRYTPVFAEDYADGRRIVGTGEIDLIAAVPADALLPSDTGLRLTFPYLESTGVEVYNSRTGENRIQENQRFSANVEKLMHELNRSQDKRAVLDVQIVSYYMRKHSIYPNINVDWTYGEPILYSVGFTDRVSGRLLNIMNSFARSLDTDTSRRMLYKELSKPITYTWKELLYIYRWQIISGMLLLLIIFCVQRLIKRDREIHRNRAESERLYQFSQLTHECLFEYDYRRDRLLLQNNRVIFPGEHMISGFMRRLQTYEYANDNERTAMQLLVEMLRQKKTRAHVRLVQNDEEYWYRIRIVYIENDSAVGRIIEDSQDIKEHKELERRASTDPLTGLLNRAAMEQMVETHLNNGNESGIYLLMDMDNFKKVNDSLGHQMGDQLLCEFTAGMEFVFRGSDIKARLGGDEFVVFMPNKISEEALKRKLEQFMGFLRETVFTRYPGCDVSVSIGAVYISKSVNTAETLYQKADEAMYVAKNRGKNGFFISDASDNKRF